MFPFEKRGAVAEPALTPWLLTCSCRPSADRGALVQLSH